MPSVPDHKLKSGVSMQEGEAEILERIDAARVDGRARNVLYRTKQLRAMHSFMLKKRHDFVQALQNDTCRNIRECDFEAAYSLEVVELHFKSLNFEEAIKKEKDIVRATKVTDWREPLGTVAILSEAWNPLHLAVAPLAAAITAGNCAILIVDPKRASFTSQMLRELINHLDNDAYTTIDFVSNEHLQTVAVDVQSVVIQTRDFDLHSRKVLCPQVGNSLAVVDKSCQNIKAAASQIANTKFLYSGTSAFAPSFVLVHEVVEGEFMRALFAATGKSFDSISVSKAEYDRITDIQNHLSSSKTRYGRVVMSGNSRETGVKDANEVSPVVIVGNRKQGKELCALTSRSPVLPVFSIRSLDDAIDFGSSLLPESALALYAFAKPADGSYLGQFTGATSVFINEIPSTLTVGAMYPDAPVLPDPFLRYTAEMFSVPKLFSVSQVVSDHSAHDLNIKPTPELQIPERPEGKRVDFFLQGLMVGGLTLLTTVTATIALGSWGAWRYFRR